MNVERQLLRSNKRFFAFVLMCLEALKAFSAKYVLVQGKIVSLQAIVAKMDEW